jgi:hypothetical protein
MQKSGKLYHKMHSKSIQCPADSDEEHSDSAAYADEEAPLPTSVKPGEHEHGEENQMVSKFTTVDCIVGAMHAWSFLHAASSKNLTCKKWKCRRPLSCPVRARSLTRGSGRI